MTHNATTTGFCGKGFDEIDVDVVFACPIQIPSFLLSLSLNGCLGYCKISMIFYRETDDFNRCPQLTLIYYRWNVVYLTTKIRCNRKRCCFD